MRDLGISAELWDWKPFHCFSGLVIVYHASQLFHYVDCRGPEQWRAITSGSFSESET